ncbi:LapA family protein [Desulfobotulus sp. H1]|uniref:LapA family protein n=1 Tax=Desulfobotulus pelophilus TaxID=2823377 RepID=A0ABT3NB64_9BACT|nr:LapA family protein [Desulfobotulus pelophilus]MCW7754708.1 LapA family protein [Desulfobotulus pelophilus]
MTRMKLILTLLVLGFIGLLFYQNQGYLLQTYTFSLNFHFFGYSFPDAPTGIYFAICFAAGFLIMFFSSLMIRFRAATRIRMLRNENQQHLETIEALQEELADKAYSAKRQDNHGEHDSSPEDAQDQRL